MTDDNAEGVARLAAGMPSLAVVGTLRSKRELGHFLGVTAPAQPKGRQIVDGLIRLSDKSVCEYQACREALLAFLRQGNADYLYRAQDHFESCVQSLHRAMNYLERLRALGYRTADGQPLVARPRDLEALRGDVRSEVRVFRDLLEHLEDDIAADRVPADSPGQLHLGWERATLEGTSLSYRDIVRWCTAVHELVAPLAQITLTVGQPPGDNRAT
jgi:hypothetical protein